jgi:hypothetical protein
MTDKKNQVTGQGLKHIANTKKSEALGKNASITADLNNYYFLGTKNNHYDHLIIAAAKKYSIDAVELKAVLQKESGERLYPNTIGSSGEVGVGQFMYKTAQGLIKDSQKLTDISDNVKLCRYEKFRAVFLKKFLATQPNWQAQDALKQIQTQLEQMTKKGSGRELQSYLTEKNKQTMETLTLANKSGPEKLREKYLGEIKTSEKIILENHSGKLIETLQAAGDPRLSAKDSIDAAAKYLAKLMDRYGSTYDTDHYEKALVAYKTGNLLGKKELKNDDRKIEDILQDKYYKNSLTLKKEVLGKYGRLARLREYRANNSAYKFEKFILLAAGEKGLHSIENPYQMALMKNSAGDEKFVSITSGQLYKSLEQAGKEFKWNLQKDTVIRAEGKTLIGAKDQLKQFYKQQQEKKKQSDSQKDKKNELPKIRDLRKKTGLIEKKEQAKDK